MRLPPPITSRTNARVKALREAFRGRASKPGEGVGVEGATLVAEAVRSGLEIDTIFVRTGAEPFLAALPESESPVAVLSREVFASVVDTASPQGLAAVLRIPATIHDLRVLGPTSFLVLEDLQDPGNLGTLIRSAEAFGIGAVILTPGCANAWTPKVIRASAGSVFRMRMVRKQIGEALRELQGQDVRIVAALVRSEGTREPREIDLRGPVAILVGNEGAGLSAGAVALAGARVHIPCRTESLNAAIAGSLLMYEAQCQQAGEPQASNQAEVAR